MIKTILMVIFIIVGLALTILATIQTKEDAGLSSTMTGAAANNFFDKSKTREGKLKKWTILLGVVFAITAIALSIVYPM